LVALIRPHGERGFWRVAFSGPRSFCSDEIAVRDQDKNFSGGVVQRAEFKEKWGQLRFARQQSEGALELGLWDVAREYDSAYRILANQWPFCEMLRPDVVAVEATASRGHVKTSSIKF